MNSKLNKKAWEIRRKASKELSCPIMAVSWKECLRLAKDELLKEDEIQDIKKTKAFFNRLKFLALILFGICAFGLFHELHNELHNNVNLISFWAISALLSFLLFGVIETFGKIKMENKIFHASHVDFY